MRRLGLIVLKVGIVCGGIFSAAASARADVVPGGGDVPPVTEAAPGLYSVRRGVQGPAGLFHSRMLLHINTDRGSAGKPISFAPDFYYSATDSLQLGLLHNLPMGWLTRPGAGLCLSGEDNGCENGVYNNVGFDLMYGLAFGDVHFSFHSSFYVLEFSAARPLMLTLGLTGKLHFSERVALYFDPQVGLALNKRDAGNPDRLFVPVELQFQIVPPVAFKLLSGIAGPLDGFSDSYTIPVGLGVVGNITEALDIGLRFSFDNLLGKIPPGSERTDFGSLALLFHLRF
jgi:hypothetical protein